MDRATISTGTRTILLLLLASATALALSACGDRPTPTPTRTPFPTYTPTPEGAQPVAVVQQAPTLPPPTPTPAPPTDTPTPEPTATPTPPPATDTPTPTVTPTATPTETPSPTPTPDYAFELEDFEQFPTQLPDTDEVRIYAYIYAGQDLALGGYSLRVVKDGQPLEVLAKSTEGLPGETRPGPNPYTRFANLGAAFFEPPAGVWEVQLIDPAGAPAGPPVRFNISQGDDNRELYVRYRRKQ